MEGYQWGAVGGRMGERVQGIRSINGRYKTDRGRLRVVWEVEKTKNNPKLSKSSTKVVE